MSLCSIRIRRNFWDTGVLSDKIQVDAHKIIKERTATARKTNKQLRDQLIKHIDDTKVLGVQRKVSFSSSVMKGKYLQEFY